MFCTNCGAELNNNGNFCPYCGTRLESATLSGSLLYKAASTAQYTNRYHLVLVTRGICNAVMAGDLLEDVFGYTDAESGVLVQMAPVVVAENLTAEEAATIAQLYTEYGMEVSIIDDQDQFVDMSGKVYRSVFSPSGSLLPEVEAVISTLTVSNRISGYRRFKKPSLLNRIFKLPYQTETPAYRRNFRPKLDPKAAPPRANVRRPAPGPVKTNPMMGAGLNAPKPGIGKPTPPKTTAPKISPQGNFAAKTTAKPKPDMHTHPDNHPGMPNHPGGPKDGRW